MEATSMANMMIGDMILGQTRAGFFAITREFEEANMGILRNNNAGWTNILRFIHKDGGFTAKNSPELILVVPQETGHVDVFMCGDQVWLTFGGLP